MPQKLDSTQRSVEQQLFERLASRTIDIQRAALELDNLHATIRELRAALDNAVEGIARLDLRQNYVAANPAYAAMHGCRPEQLLGTGWETTLAPEDRELAGKLFGEAQASGKASGEVRALRRDGSRFYKSAALSRVSDRYGQITGWYLFEKNITDRKEAEAALRESEACLRQLTETIREGFWVSDREGSKFYYVSPAFEHTFGLTRQELEFDSQAWKRAVVSEDLPKVQAARTEQLQSGVADVTYRIRRADGVERWVRDRAFPIRDAAGNVYRFAGIAADVTESKHLEDELRRGRSSFENLIRSCDVAMMVTDEDGKVLFLNPAAATLLDQPLEALIGQVFAPATAHEARQELPLRRGDQFAGVAELSVIHTEWEGTIAHLVILHDITARKQAEASLKSHAAELKRSNKELEDFAFVASHDLQEPVRKIKAFGERLSRKCATSLDETARDYLDRMISASERMEKLITSLLDYSRVTTRAQPFEQVKLNAVIGEVLQDVELLLERSGGKVEVGPLPELEADPTQVRQVFQNLIVNALKFRKPDTAPLVRVFEEPYDPTRTEHLARGPCCRVVVADNGIGFEDKYRERIFEVFQRLHGRGEYEGSGMGLAVCRKIVERHNGRIAAEGRPGQGARFLVTLPLRQPRPAGGAA